MNRIYLLISIIIIAVVITFVLINEPNDDDKIISRGGVESMNKRDEKQRFNPNRDVNKQVKELSMSIIEKEINGKKQFLYKVENDSQKRQTLKFNTSQRYDYEITDVSGTIVFRFSEGKSFMQALASITLEPGDDLQYDIIIPTLEPGRYIISIVLVAEGLGHERETKNFNIN